MYDTILTALQDGIFTITINRPAKLNALNGLVIAELNKALDEVYFSENIRAAIITGAGEKAFVAGADIAEFKDLSAEVARELAQAGQDTFFRIENCPKPIVACVNGFALGGGCELAMSCHFRIASETAQFGQPEVNLGLIPGYGGTQRLTQLIGKGRAMEHILSAKPISAPTALQYGLVNYVVAPELLLAKAVEILAAIVTKAPLAVAASIGAINAVFDETRDGYAAEIEGFAFCFGTEDADEGIRAFIQKRPPVFAGK